MRDNRQELDPVIEEYVCDYVDETMDPAVAEVFEEYLEEHQEIREYVQSSQKGRRYLNTLRFKGVAYPNKFTKRLKHKIELERQIDAVEASLPHSDSMQNTIAIISLILTLILGGTALLL